MDDRILNDIHRQISSVIVSLINQYGPEQSLAVPAVLLKTTLQIYMYTLESQEDVEAIIKCSLESLNELPPLIKPPVLH